MQNVKLTNYQRPDKSSVYTLQKRYYHVCAAHSVFYFKSERRLKLWLGELNRELNVLSMELNSIYAELFSEYRYYYLHLASSERLKFEQRFAAIDKTFDYLTTRCNGRSSNSWAYQYAERLIALMNEITENLSAHKMNNLATVQRYRLANVAARVASVKTRLYNLPEGYDKRKDYERP